MNYSITQFWYVLEQLTPFNLTGAIKDLKYCAPILKTDDDKSLPWLNPEILIEQFKMPLGCDNKGKPIEYSYRVYLSVFPEQLIFDFLQSLPKPVAPAFNDLASNTKNLSCFASFTINHAGLLVDETLTYSTVPWALKQVQTVFTSKKKLNLEGWTKEYQEHTNHLKRLFSSYAKATAEAEHQVTVADLTTLIESLCLTPTQWQPDRLTYLGYYTVQRKSQSNDDMSTDILNSFYLSDLETASRTLKANTASKPLKQYLVDRSPQQLPVEDKFFLQQYLSPKYLPYGRWPSNPAHNLSLMQQCAVNLALTTLNRTGGIFSVNGPPGTGKTTLLRDSIADLIVQRANRLVSYEQPSDAFSDLDGIYCLDSSLTGFEIVVASSNNGAVENVTAELPSLEAIAEPYQKQTIYLRKVAQSVREKTQEKFNQNSQKTKNEIYQFPGKLEEIEEELDIKVLESNNQSVWGLIAAVLGNKINCGRFCDGFWYDRVNSIRAPLKGEDVPQEKPYNKRQAWQSACGVFQQWQQKVKELIDQRQHYADIVRNYAELPSQYEQAKATLREHERLVSQKNHICQQARHNLSEIQKQMNERQRYIETIHLGKPSFFSRLFDTTNARQYQQRMDTAQQEFERIRKQVFELETNLRQAESEYQRVNKLYLEAQTKVYEKERELKSIEVIGSVKQKLGEAFADSAWWERPYEEFQLSAPWLDVELNEARTQLFLAALNVHEQFIRNASRPMMKNLGRWVDMVKGQWGGLTDSQVLYLWQTFFLVVPVISTTFASIQRLFYRLGPESLGWLLIDEAGQGTPQAAVGALQRAKRVVVVGDPLQIKPVVTLDSAIVEGLRQYFGVDECWSPNKASIQSICDRANPYGTTIETDTEPLWIGCPLWVHRRCIDPMVTLANRIAYNSKMVMATQIAMDKHFPLGESCWIDIEGTCQGRHWVPEQGETIIQLLKQVIDIQQSLPSLYIISPFRIVAIEMRKLLKQKKYQWARKISNDELKIWIERSVGTVHTFQGKEADTVILILGTDEKSRGAAEWAVTEPNILNVAATRAKYRFYIVGSKRLWSCLKYFDTAYELLANSSLDL